MTIASSQSEFLPSKPVFRGAILAVLFAAGLALRLYGITAPPTEFHPMRQFRAAIIARDLYFRSVPTAAPEWQRQIAAEDASHEEFLEPRILETLAAVLYQLAGGEYLWLPRLFSVIFWLVGGMLLFRLAAKLISLDGALVAVAFFLLDPFGVLASRIFQPDPLMILLYLAGLNLIVWYDDEPSWPRLVAAAVVSSASPFVKPISLFALFMAFVALSFYRRRNWRGVVNPQVIAYGAILSLPTAVFYLRGILAGTGLNSEVSTDIIPSLLLTRSYYAGWFTQIGKAIGPVIFLAALLGVAIMREGRIRYLVIGLWVGYVLMGLVFSYTVSTHDYYQLQLYPTVGMCLAPVITPLLDRLRRLFSQDLTRTAFISLLVVILAMFSAYENWWRTTFRYFYENTDPAVARIGPEIGDIVGHSTHVVVLSAADGRPLIYYAWIGAINWPASNEMAAAAARGAPVPSAADEFTAIRAGASAEYFIVTDLPELERQPQLKGVLSRYPQISTNPAYLIYDLRQPGP